jgi:xylulokinase
MSGPRFLSIDLGTTAVKVALFEADGGLLALSVQELQLQHPTPEQTEIDARVIWHAVVAGARDVLARVPGSGSSLAGVGISSQAQTFVLLDEAGEPVRPAVMWIDARAGEESEEFARKFSRDECLLRLGRPSVTAVASAPKLRWLSKHEPETLSRAHDLLLLPDYLLWRLTGERVTDPVTAGSTGFYHTLRAEWWLDAIEFAGAGHLRLPELRRPGECAGTLLGEAARETGLPQEVPCAVGTNDQLTGALGAGNVEPGTVSETTGTALALVMTARADPKAEKDAAVAGGPHPAGDDLRYVLAYSKTAGIVLKWFRDQFCPTEDYDKLFEMVAGVPIGSDGVTCLPHFSGTATPHFKPDATGAFTGLRLSHTPAHLARAIVESLTFDLLLNVRFLEEAVGSVTTIRAMGGGARSSLWLQMKADVLGLPVERVACSEAASLGAAELAMAAVGEFASVAEASRALYRSDRTFEPDADRGAQYARPLKRYEALYETLYGEGRS